MHSRTYLASTEAIKALTYHSFAKLHYARLIKLKKEGRGKRKKRYKTVEREEVLLKKKVV